MTYVSTLPELPVSSPPHSRLGLVSFALSLVIAVGVVALLIVAPDESAGTARMIAEVAAWTTLVAAGTGVILGIVAAFQPDCRKIFGYLGIGLNVVAVFVTGSLMAVGAIAY